MGFLLNQQEIALDEQLSRQTVLSYLRDLKGLTGTKEGCASGDCGACTVVVGEVVSDKMQYKAVNSCVTFMSSLHGKQLLTVEHLGTPNSLHPVQQALVEEHGSQCGFCTPGFIMSMFALYHDERTIERPQVIDALSGNLCRCTGYRPIIDASLKVCQNHQPDQFDALETQTVHRLNNIKSKYVSKIQRFLPQTSQELARLKSQMPDARIVAGSTDVALEHTQDWKDLGHLINVSQVKQLKQIEITDTGLRIGAAVTISEAEPIICQYFPDLKELISRFASRPIRNQGTLGGNMANASPIGDFPPVMLALDGTLTLTNGSNERIISIRDFYIGYRQTVMKKDEWIESLFLPFLSEHEFLRTYKVSKRFEDDISAVCAVFKISLQNDRIVSFKTGFGGVAATPLSAVKTEYAVEQLIWRQADTVKKAKQVLQNEFNPIDDVRASAAYRVKMVQNLLHRFWLETTQKLISTRVTEHA